MSQYFWRLTLLTTLRRILTLWWSTNTTSLSLLRSFGAVGLTIGSNRGTRIGVWKVCYFSLLLFFFQKFPRTVILFCLFVCFFQLEFSEGLDAIFARNGSVNLYMFHGGTSFGFMNGGNAITVLPYEAFDVSSYDYGAPLSECGNYTDKYDWLSERLTKVDPLSSILIRPDRPDFVEPIKYQDVVFNQYLSYHDMMQQVVSRTMPFFQ